MPQTLNGYQPRERLHEESSTLIYRAVQTSTQTSVLVKLLQSDYATLEDIARLKHEYLILQSLDRASVIKANQLEAARALILEDFDGLPLSTLLSQQSLYLSEILHIGIQLAETLAYLHEQRIIHKNLKTANIWFDPATQQVMLFDFSLATWLGHETQTVSNPNLLEGTLAYLSPEQTGRMNRTIDYRTDFYSLGVVLYELLTGQLPFQASDPLELIHCHIARAPLSPYEWATSPQEELHHPRQRTMIPIAVSNIVMKLLAKTAEDRYQNALGLKADLEICLQQLKVGEIKPFAIGQLDLYSQFSISQKLYGREAEVALLLSAFERVAGQGCELMLVSGYSGIGKSSLVHEIHKPISALHNSASGDRRCGYFISGKFDQFKRNIPYAAFIQAFQELLRQLLTESAERFTYWRTQMLEALGANAQVIIEVIPEVEQLIGPQPPSPELAPAEAQTRFNRVFGQFIQVFCQAAHPLVLFLDDLQWADAASLRLIELLLSDPTRQYLLLIGAYRDNEVSAAHPLIATIAEVEKSGRTIHRIVLDALQPADLNQLIADTLHREDVAELAELVFHKTQGNPFFLSQLLKSLYQDHLIWFDFEQAQWQWNVATLQHVNITDNVVDLMVSRIQKLQPAGQNILQLAACVGDKFTLSVLSIVQEKSLSETAADLWEALQIGLVLPLNQAYKIPLVLELEETLHTPIAYKFLHDRVQQAAYSLIPEPERNQTHLRIGKLLLGHTSEDELEDNVFEIVNHLNAGAALILNSEMRVSLGRLNLMAGQKAKAAIAYEPALRYLRIAIDLLSDTSWTDQYELTLALYDATIEVELLNAHYDQANDLVKTALGHVQTILDQVAIYKRTIQLQIAQGDFAASIQSALTALTLLDVILPTTPEEIEIYCQQLRSELQFTSSQIAALVDLPPITDRNKQAAIEILNTMPGPVYISKSELLLPMMLTMTHLSVKYGNCAPSAFAYCMYGLLLAGAYREIEQSYEFGQLALRVSDRFNDKALEARVLKVYGSHLQHAKEPIHATIQTLQRAAQISLETGNPEYLGYGSSEYGIHLFFSGESLDTVNQKLLPYVELVDSFKQDLGICYVRLGWQVTLNLLTPSEHPHQLMGKGFDEETMLPIVVAANWRTLLCCFYLFKLILAYLFHDDDAALCYANSASEYLDSVAGMVMDYEFNFYQSLTLLRRSLQPESSVIEQVQRNQEMLQQRSHYEPTHFLHKYELVEAEIARVLGQSDRAMEYYDLAIQHAQENGYKQEEAIASECAAAFYTKRKRNRVAKDYLIDAYRAYVRWGATAKVQQLLNRHPQILITPAAPSREFVATHTTHLGSASLDLATVIKASQALSDEIVLDKLLDKLMNCAIENAGATSGMLVLEQNQEWTIAAVGFADRNNEIFLPPHSGNPNDLPMSVIQAVIQSQTVVVLNSFASIEELATDPYILSHHPQSILGLPILYQTQLKGILYLENTLMQDAFNQDHVEVLKLLAAQAAISLENAQLYQALQQYSQQLEMKNTELSISNSCLADEIVQRQRIEQERENLLDREKQARIQAEQANRVKDEFLAILSHELRTPLNPILGWSKLLRSKQCSPAMQEQALETIERNAQLQARLVEDLLNMSSILQGKLTLNVHPLDLSLPIVAAIDTLQLAINAKSIQIETQIEPNTAFVLGDFSRLQQVFWNLISNAVRFTPEEGRIAIQLHCSANQALVTVQDTGKGISLEFLPHVFETFRQADSTTTRQHGGLGLGLAIARQIIELHGGTIAADSPGESQGATFTVRLPLTLALAQNMLPDTPLFKSSLDLKHFCVLVVDDEPDSRDLAAFVLRQAGAATLTAASAREAIELFMHTKPDILVTDIGMAEMNGYELLQQIRTASGSLSKPMPAIALTAFAGESNQQAVLAAGFQYHLEKPINPEVLVSVITDLLHPENHSNC